MLFSGYFHPSINIFMLSNDLKIYDEVRKVMLIYFLNLIKVIFIIIFLNCSNALYFSSYVIKLPQNSECPANSHTVEIPYGTSHMGFQQYGIAS